MQPISDNINTEQNRERDTWKELRPIILLGRIIGQGSGGIDAKIYMLTIIVVEALISLYWIFFGQRSWETVLARVTEGGQVLVLYFSACWSGLCAILYRHDKEIITILNVVQVEGKYNAATSYQKLALKLTIVVPFIILNVIFSKEIVYKSNWTFSVFYLPIFQLIVAQLQMTTLIDMLSRKMEALTEEFLKSNGRTRSTKEFKQTRSAWIMEKLLGNSSNSCRVTPSKFFTITDRNIQKDTLSQLISGHVLLQEAGSLINLSFGLQTLISLGRTFVIVTFNCFLLIRKEMVYHFRNGTISELIQHSFSMVTLIVIHLAELWSLVSSAYRFSDNAERFTRNIYAASIENDTDILAEMDIVKCHIESRKPSEISACGFISVNYTLITCMLGAITTYIVIIVQIGTEEEI